MHLELAPRAFGVGFGVAQSDLSTIVRPLPRRWLMRRQKTLCRSCWHQSHLAAELCLFPCHPPPPLITVLTHLCPVLPDGEVATQPVLGGVSVGCPVVRHAGDHG